MRGSPSMATYMNQKDFILVGSSVNLTPPKLVQDLDEQLRMLESSFNLSTKDSIKLMEKLVYAQKQCYSIVPSKLIFL